ncbi:MAG: flagellar protein [Clostridiales bacterium]|jgi:flagellar operon protein (TIGR03826 family)|nr:flagellar protein [Clostridiales bacterium]
MEMRNCVKCKRPFTYRGVPICQDCEKDEEKVFDEVRTYIKQHPDVTLAVVSEVTGCSHKKILRWIKEGRIEISQASFGEIACESCGKPITKGRYCEKCVIKINNQVSDTFGKETISTQTKIDSKTGKAKMHIKGRG